MTRTLKQKKASLQYMPKTSASEVARQIVKGGRIIGLTQGQFSLIDLIYSILETHGSGHIACATWSAGIKDANTVKWMLDTNLIQSFILITDHSYVNRQPKYAIQLTDLFGKDNIRTSEIHAKFCTIETQDMKITIRTSMNLNANKTCESFEIDEDADIFGFYHSFIEGVFGEMPKGFTASSYIANRGLNVVMDNLKDDFSWQNQNNNYTW